MLTEFSKSGIWADIILNDIVNAELDTKSINAENASSITPLSASCACCESLDNLLNLCKTASETKGDLLLLELNGTADPLALIENFSLLKDTLPFNSIVQICIIDVRNWGNRDRLDPIEKRQMESSTFYLLSHTDKTDSESIINVEKDINDNYPKSQKITSKRLANALIKSAKNPSINQLEFENHQTSNRINSNHDENHLLSHQVKGIRISLPPKVRRVAIERLLKNLPFEVLRAKAFVKLVEEPGTRWLFEKVGSDLSPAPISIQSITHLSSSLLCVGLELDVEKIRKIVIDEFGYFPEIQ